MRSSQVLLFCFLLIVSLGLSAAKLAPQEPTLHSRALDTGWSVAGLQNALLTRAKNQYPVLVKGAQDSESGTAKTICGLTDDRVPSSDSRIGRIEPSGCTAWNINNGKLLTAGHCIDDLENNSVSFKVPPSLADGTRQLPAAKDQYLIDHSSVQFSNNGVGDDWAVFTVFDNAQTGKQPLAVEGGFDLAQTLTSTNIRVTGFGVDFDDADGMLNRTNQTHVGGNIGSSGTVLRYDVDTTAGNSGSPVIDEATGAAIGIHTHGGCHAVGANKGTSFFNVGVWAAINECLDSPPSQALSNGVALDGLFATQGCTELRFTFDVPAGMSDLQFVTRGSIANADLYVKLGTPPTISSYDCASNSGSSNENCSFTNPSAGEYFALIIPTSSFTELSMTATYLKEESLCFPIKKAFVCL